MINTIHATTEIKAKYEFKLFKIRERLAAMRYINSSDTWSDLKAREQRLETKIRAINILMLSKAKRK